MKNIPDWAAARAQEPCRRQQVRRARDRRVTLDMLIAAGVPLLASLWGIEELLRLHLH